MSVPPKLSLRSTLRPLCTSTCAYISPSNSSSVKFFEPTEIVAAPLELLHPAAKSAPPISVMASIRVMRDMRGLSSGLRSLCAARERAESEVDDEGENGDGACAQQQFTVVVCG